MSNASGDKLLAECLKSVDDAVPAEEGGPTARKGFSYQDEICVGFLVKMLGCSSLIKIHCETHDDLVLVWNDGGERTAEYVQVKGGEPDKLWSVADLCKPDSSCGSLFEKSLQRDAHIENALFRLVTLRDVVGDLKPLTYPPGSVGREPDCEGIVTLRDGINAKCPNAKSKKKNGVEFWLDRCVWDVRHDQDDVAAANLNALLIFAHSEGHLIYADQAQVLLEDLRSMAKTAGSYQWIPDKEKKIIVRSALRGWWEARLAALLGESGPAGGKLAQKLREAGASDDIVAAAVDQRRRYAAAVRTSKYMSDDAAEDLQSTIRPAMLELRTKYMAGDVNASALGFLELCMGELRLIAAAHPEAFTGRTEFAYGCMFDIADRCLLRFARPVQ